MKLDRAIRLALANVQKEGLTDIFSRPFELDLLPDKDFQKQIHDLISKAIRGGSLQSLGVSPLGFVLLPKTAAFDFRRCALMEPLDTLKYLSLVVSMADQIEKARPERRKQVVFSYRFGPARGYLFDPKANMPSFRRRTSNNARQRNVKVVVSCDIANFYDRLNLHRLESVLLSLGIDPHRVKLLNELLLSWANRDSYGLPVGSNASRILAEAALLEVDRFLLDRGVKYCRFVDDYRLFAPNTKVAHLWLTMLIERLWLEGLTINKAKTRIDDSSVYARSRDGSDDKNGTRSSGIESEEGSRPSSEGGRTPPKAPQRIIAGYGGTVPTKFREVPSSKREKYRTDLAHELEKRIRT